MLRTKVHSLVCGAGDGADGEPYPGEEGLQKLWEEVLELCQSLRLHSTRANRNRSLNDLQSHANKGIWSGGGRGGASGSPNALPSCGGVDVSAGAAALGA